MRKSFKLQQQLRLIVEIEKDKLITINTSDPDFQVQSCHQPDSADHHNKAWPPPIPETVRMHDAQ